MENNNQTFKLELDEGIRTKNSNYVFEVNIDETFENMRTLHNACRHYKMFLVKDKEYYIKVVKDGVFVEKIRDEDTDKFRIMHVNCSKKEEDMYDYNKYKVSKKKIKNILQEYCGVLPGKTEISVQLNYCSHSII